MANDNNALFDAGMDKANQIIYNHLTSILYDVCDQSVVYAMTHHKGFANFTGNTHTGYACGLYENSKLVWVTFSADYAKPPIRVKLTKGEMVSLDPDYDGNARSFKAVVATDQGFGQPYALRFLEAHTPKNSKGFSLCLTTGTEYSEFLEVVRHADVLTGTFHDIPKILFNNLKPIP